MDGKRDGLCRKNILASFTHLHALGTPEWAEAMVGRARQYRQEARQRVGKSRRLMQDKKYMKNI